ncbi:MAG: TIGR02391 family protein [Candidatus Lokiarchaeota archaeon]|nr:TIGR02391 family protein [Candidatus Lokiarchaeota archaeon]
MNLQSHIKTELWLAVESAYKSENYNHAIVDAIHYLTNVIRDKSGVDGDGESLIGQAFGGHSPKLRINKLQTQSEQDEQKGLVQLLIGLYKGIRNPRSHEQITDDQITADAIIYFINYLVCVIDKSQEPFTISQFMERVFDPDFVKSSLYAELLVNEIPDNKRFDTLIEIFRKKLDGEGSSLAYVAKEIIDRLTADQIEEFLIVVSSEFRVTSSDKEIISTLQILPEHLWTQLDEDAQIRIEHKFYNSVKEGQYDYFSENCFGGEFGTWSRRFLQYFKSKSSFSNLFSEKLEAGGAETAYIANFFFGVLPTMCELTYQRDRCIDAIFVAIGDGDGFMQKKLLDNISVFPDDWNNQLLEKISTIDSMDSDYYKKLKSRLESPF